MYPSIHLSPPLTPPAFYILLGLCRGQRHGYSIGGLATNNSLGSVKMPDSTLYSLLKRMCENNLIEEAGLQPAGKSRRDRMYYRTTNEGELRLKDELKRMQHAVKIGESANLMKKPTA